MDKETIVQQRLLFDETNSNHHVADTMIGTAAIYSLSWIANELGLFYLDETMMRISVALMVVLLTVPAILVKTHKFDNERHIKYLLLCDVSIFTFVVVTLFSFHMTLFIVMPLILSTFYHSRKYNITAIIMTIAIALFAPILSFKLGMLDADFITWLLYAIKPEIADDPVFAGVIKEAGKTPEKGLFLFYGIPHALFAIAYSLISGSVNRKRIVDQIVWTNEVFETEKEKEKALEIAKAKSDFLATMSHEIRTPINAVLGMNSAILRESTDETVLGYAADVDGAGQLLLSLINDILDYSKLEAGKMTLTSDSYSIKQLVKNCYNMVEKRAGDKGLDLKTSVKEGTPLYLVGDLVRVQQIVTNILTNAVKYTEKGSVTLEAFYEEGKLHVSISDTGIGIKKEDIGILFTAFDRLDVKKNAAIEGTGLGLAITNKLVNLMGGEIKVDSEYGKGSTFHVVIPQEIGTGSEKPESSERVGGTSLGKNKDLFTAESASILVVDDVKLNLRVTRTLLKNTLVLIDEAADGDGAIEKVKMKRYDVILLDHSMPGKDGIETLDEMKKTKECLVDGVPVIALTANYSAGAKEMYVSAGFTDYLAKPYTVKELQEMLIKYIPADKVTLI